jgi:hypothetical protein
MASSKPESGERRGRDELHSIGVDYAKATRRPNAKPAHGGNSVKLDRCRTVFVIIVSARHLEVNVFHMLASLATAAIAGGSALFGYWQARQFTQNKLRYVDAVHKAIVPVVAGAAAVAVAAPIVWLLPLVGGGTALLFGGGVAMGVSAGARDIRKRLAGGT